MIKNNKIDPFVGFQSALATAREIADEVDIEKIISRSPIKTAQKEKFR